jgi:hypothetical protein
MPIRLTKSQLENKTFNVNEKVSRQWFNQQIRTVIDELDLNSRYTASTPLMDEIIYFWLFDIMSQKKLLDYGWWDELEEWSKSSEKKQLAAQFMYHLVAAFSETLKYHRNNLVGIITQFVPPASDSKKEPYEERYDAEGYYDLILDLQHTIWAVLPTICVIGGHASGDMFGIGNFQSICRLDG